MLLPALLGALTLKQVDLSRRREHLETAREHFLRFLRLCRNYGLGSFQLSPGTSSTSSEQGAGSPSAPRDPAQPNLVAMAMSRTAKIERWALCCGKGFRDGSGRSRSLEQCGVGQGRASLGIGII